MQLEEIGVVWDMHSQHRDDTFTLLLHDKDREGNCNILQNHEEDEENLGKWLT